MMGFLAPWFLAGLAALGVPVFVHLRRRHVAFPNPLLRPAPAGNRGPLLLIVLDNSFSMRAGTRFADAKQQALALLAAKTHSQKAQVIALGGQVEVLTQQIADQAQLRSALESIQAGDGH